MIKQKRSFNDFLFDNKVALLFILLCIGAFFASKDPSQAYENHFAFLMRELFTRIGRNGFMVLSLIIPVLTGMGLNFGIVIGAIASQIAMFWVIYWGFTGMQAILLILLIAIPIAVLFGWMVGTLFNNMKGSEMIGGMVLKYFSDGLYQLLFLFIIGAIIPVDPTSNLIISGGIGVKNSIDLQHNIKYAIDNIPMLTIIELLFFLAVFLLVGSFIYLKIKKQPVDVKRWGIQLGVAVAIFAVTFIPAVENILIQSHLPLLTVFELGLLSLGIYRVGRIVLQKRRGEEIDWKYEIPLLLVIAGVYGLSYLSVFYAGLTAVQIPVFTYLAIAGLCLFNSAIMKTRLGQNMRTVGQNRTVANAAGINVDRTRVIAMILSTVLACIGQVISLQSIGTLSTYGAHTQVGEFAIAALLVGGASVQKATNKQALVGVVLFHTLFILSPIAGKNLFGNAQIGEYFRVFVAYGVIAVSLAMHAWQSKKPKEEKGKVAGETA